MAFAATGLVDTVKVTDVAFPGTVTLAGTLAAAVLLLDSVTRAPAAGAGPVKVTVPVEEVPPITETGFKLTVVRVAATTVNVVVRVVLKVPEIVGEVVVPTPLVVTVKVADVALAGTVTLAGTLAAAVLLLDRVTTAPPAGAGPVKVAVPVEDVPPITDVGFTLMALRVGAVTVNVVVRVLPRVAETVGEVFEATGLVVTVNVAEVAFAATVTLAGTCAAAVLLLDKLTTVPPEGAGPVIRTVPVEEVPPITEVGLIPRALTVGASTAKVAVFATP